MSNCTCQWFNVWPFIMLDVPEWDVGKKGTQICNIHTQRNQQNDLHIR